MVWRWLQPTQGPVFSSSGVACVLHTGATLTCWPKLPQYLPRGELLVGEHSTVMPLYAVCLWLCIASVDVAHYRQHDTVLICDSDNFAVNNKLID